MIFKFVIVFALVASPALCSSIKGYSQQQQRSEEPKGGRPLLGPIEQQRRLSEQQAKGYPYAAKQQQTEQLKVEQVSAEDKTEQYKQEPLEQVKEEKIEQLQQQREEFQQQKLEEPKGGRYEARPQLAREELAKGQQQQQQQKEELSKTSKKAEELPLKVEQQREELPARKGESAEPARFEEQKEVQQQQKEEKYEQQRSTDFDSQIELKEEQRRYEEPSSPLVQPILPLTIVEETREQRVEQQAVKGGYVQAAPGAPFGEAEPYAFSYQVDGSSRSESGDSKGVVRGQYTLQGADGSSRVVEYIADQNGFRASVNTNEFGTESKSPAGVALRTSQPNAEDITLRLEGKTKEDLVVAPSQSASTQSKVSYTKESWPKRQPAAKGEQQQIQQTERRSKFTEWNSSSQGAPEKIVAAAPAQAKSAEPARVANFESATAHRAYKVAPSSSGPRKQAAAPAVLVRNYQLQPPVRSFVAGHQPAVSRSYLRSERYPPAPVVANRPAGVHYAYPAAPPQPAGVSFYSQSQPATGPINFEEELPSFIESSER